MIEKGFHFEVYREACRFGYAFFILNSSEKTVIKPLDIWVQPEEPLDGTIKQPTFQLDDHSTQSLMNELWKAGVRPNNGESSLAHVDAMKYHLEDMRKLVKGLK